MLREKQFVEYPLAESLEQAIAWMEAGNECWREDSSDWPQCGGIETVGDLRQFFPDGLNKTDNVHLVLSIDEKAEPFKVGDTVLAIEEVSYCCGQDENDVIDNGEACIIDSIENKDNEQRLFFTSHADRYGPWLDKWFVLCVE